MKQSESRPPQEPASTTTNMLAPTADAAWLTALEPCPDCGVTTGPDAAHAPGCPVGAGMDSSSDKDRAYFEAHPGRTRWQRGLYPEEATALRLQGFIVDPFASVAITVLGPGVRARRYSGVW